MSPFIPRFEKKKISERNVLFDCVLVAPAVRIDLDIFAMAIAEIAAHLYPAKTLSSAIDKLCNECLCHILALNKHISSSLNQPNPLQDSAVCDVLLDYEARLKRIFTKFATYAQPAPLGHLLTQSDLERCCLYFNIVPALIAVRQLAWIFRDVKAARGKDTFEQHECKGLQSDEYMEALARISAVAFASGQALGRNLDNLQNSERLLLLFAFMDFKKGTEIISREENWSRLLCPSNKANLKKMKDQHSDDLVDMLLNEKANTLAITDKAEVA